MIETRYLSENLYCCGQIFEKDLESIRSIGYEVLICARPDGEKNSQPNSCDLQTLSESLGLKYEHIPFRNCWLDPEASRKFCRRSDHLRKNHKVLAFCRSGNRIIDAWLHSDWQLSD